MKLFDVVLRHRNFMPRFEDQLRDFCVSGNLLFIASAERSQVEIGQDEVDLPVCQFRTFNACRGSNGFNSRHPPQCRQAIGR